MHTLAGHRGAVTTVSLGDDKIVTGPSLPLPPSEHGQSLMMRATKGATMETSGSGPLPRGTWREVSLRPQSAEHLSHLSPTVRPSSDPSLRSSRQL